MNSLARTGHRLVPQRFSPIERDPFSIARQLLGWDPFEGTERRSEEPAFIPAFDVVEKEDAYVLTADLPGVSESDVDVTLHDSRLTISGRRDAEERKEGDDYYLYERRYGSFSRSFALPDNTDPEAVDARLDSGVLTVRVGKRPESKPRKIALK